MSLGAIYVWMYAILGLAVVGLVMTQVRYVRAKRAYDAEVAKVAEGDVTDAPPVRTTVAGRERARPIRVYPLVARDQPSMRVTQYLTPVVANGFGNVAAVERAFETVLTVRERECLSLVSQHKTSSQIAFELGLSKHTVDWHLDKARKRLGAADRFQAAALAFGTNTLQQEDDRASAISSAALHLEALRSDAASGYRRLYALRGWTETFVKLIYETWWSPFSPVVSVVTVLTLVLLALAGPDNVFAFLERASGVVRSLFAR